MSTTMIEKIARALAIADRYDPDENPNYVSENMMTDMAWPVGARLWWRYRTKARTVIEAMREPTEAMLQAGDFVNSNPWFVAKAWKEMCDAALNEKDS